MYLNARSIVNKIDSLAVIVSDLKPDIIGLTESWATDNITDAEISIPGYTLFRTDRPTGNKGGGVLLYVLSTLQPASYCPQASYPEHVWCKLNTATLRNSDLLIGVCYRSSSAELFDDNLHKSLRKVITEVSNKNILLMGDFNYPSIDWATHSVQDAATSEAQLFLDHLDDCFLTQHVQLPTRKKATLDLVVTREPDLVHMVEAREPLERSDHNMITWECHLDVCHSVTNHQRRNYAKADFSGIRTELQQIDWDTLLSGDIHFSWLQFKNKLHDLESKYVPLSSPKSKQESKPIWMTNKALKLEKEGFTRDTRIMIIQHVSK